jgi:signal transduction histidine kinase
MSSARSEAFEPGLTGDASMWSWVGTNTQCRHEVQFYFDDRFLIQSLSSFFRTALDSGGSVIVVATKSHRESLAEALQRAGIRLTAAIQQGRYVALDAAETLAQFTVDDLPDEAQFRKVLGNVVACAAAARRKGSGVAIFGEMVSLLWQHGKTEAALQLEQFWNRLSEFHSFHLRCGYPIASFDREVHTELFSRICGEHEVVIPAEDYSGLADENDRLRTVARLQHAEQLLKKESEERRLAQHQTLAVQTRNEELLKEIRQREEAEDELRRFTRRLLAVRDEEQRIIAAELHENTAQLLAALSLYFGVLQEEKPSLNPRLASIVDSSRAVSESLLTEIRKLSHLLHPPTLDEMGLSSALKEYIDQFIASSGARVALEIPGELGRFDRKLEIAVFRIVEEGLANIYPRFGKAFATVRLKRGAGSLIVEIQNPQPKSVEALSSGAAIPTRPETRITGIQERAAEHGGTVQFTSDPSGIFISVTLPVETQNTTAQATEKDPSDATLTADSPLPCTYT